jgi:hypothetical protein
MVAIRYYHMSQEGIMGSPTTTVAHERSNTPTNMRDEAILIVSKRI